MPTYVYVPTSTVVDCPPASRAGLSLLGAPYEGDVYQGTPASCSKLAVLPAGYTFYSVGAVLDPSLFVKGSPTTE